MRRGVATAASSMRGLAAAAARPAALHTTATTTRAALTTTPPQRAACSCLGAPVAAQATLAAAARQRQRVALRRSFSAAASSSSSTPPPAGDDASDDAKQTPPQEALPPRAPLIKPPPRRPPLFSSGGAADASASPRAAPTPPPQRAFAPGETLSFSVAGVTFGARQDAVRAAAPGVPLLLLREPENPVDTHAVAVLDVAGQPLGYVPRALTGAFADTDCVAGRVGETGVNEAGVAWLTAEAKPAGPAVLAALHPARAPPPLLRAALPPDARRALETAAGGGACAGCGACGAAAAQGTTTDADASQPPPPPAVAPRPAWRFDPVARVATLTGLVPLCDACDAVAHLPDDAETDASSTTEDALLSHLAAANAWSREQAAQYVAWVRRERARRAGLGAWRVDASWLRRAHGGVVDEAAVAALEAGTGAQQ
jgi:hypothetical protein